MTLDELIEWARAYVAQHPLTEWDVEQQAQSFAYGNLKIERPDLTWEEFIGYL